MAKQQYKIKYLPAAQADLLEIFEYIYPHNLSVADHLLDAFDSEILKLKSLPYLSVVIDDYELRTKRYRRLVVEKYYVFYVVYEDELLVKVH